MTGPQFEKCFVTQFGRCANIAACTDTRLGGGAQCSEAANLSRLLLCKTTEMKANTSEQCNQETR